MSEGPEEIVVRCMRCAAGDYPAPVGAARRSCARCGVEVWLDVALPDDIAKMFPGRPYTLLCAECDVSDESSPVVTADAQIERLLAGGLRPEQVAHILAVGVAAAGKPLDETQLEIMLNPRGDKAQAYRRALTEAKITIAGILRRN